MKKQPTIEQLVNTIQRLRTYECGYHTTHAHRTKWKAFRCHLRQHGWKTLTDLRYIRWLFFHHCALLRTPIKK